jgi:hypothetical protein
MTQSDDVSVVARFQVTPEEMYDAIFALSQSIYGFKQGRSRFGKYHNWVVAALSSVVTFVIFFSVTLFAIVSNLMTTDTVFLVTMSMVVSAVLLLVWYTAFQKRRIRFALARQNFNSEVTVTDDGQFLSWNAADYKHSWGYDKFDTLLSYKDGYYLVSGLSGLFIPGHAFADVHAKTRFENILKEKMRPSVVAAFLQAEGR